MRPRKFVCGTVLHATYDAQWAQYAQAMLRVQPVAAWLGPIRIHSILNIACNVGGDVCVRKHGVGYELYVNIIHSDDLDIRYICVVKYLMNRSDRPESRSVSLQVLVLVVLGVCISTSNARQCQHRVRREHSQCSQPSISIDTNHWFL